MHPDACIGTTWCASPPHPLCSYPRPHPLCSYPRPIGGAQGVRVPDRLRLLPEHRQSPDRRGRRRSGRNSARPHAASRAVRTARVACATDEAPARLRAPHFGGGRRTAGRRALRRCRGSRTVLRGRHRGAVTVRRGLGTCQGAVVAPVTPSSFCESPPSRSTAQPRGWGADRGGSYRSLPARIASPTAALGTDGRVTASTAFQGLTAQLVAPLFGMTVVDSRVRPSCAQIVELPAELGSARAMPRAATRNRGQISRRRPVGRRSRRAAALTRGPYGFAEPVARGLGLARAMRSCPRNSDLPAPRRAVSTTSRAARPAAVTACGPARELWSCPRDVELPAERGFARAMPRAVTRNGAQLRHAHRTRDRPVVRLDSAAVPCRPRRCVTVPQCGRGTPRPRCTGSQGVSP